jgi:hypothetical protein
MEVGPALAEFGTEAVLSYRKIAGLQHDNDLPESFISAHLAPRLHERFKVPVRTEFSYLRIAIERFRVPKDERLVRLFGGQRADIALLPEGNSPVVIELKILDEQTGVTAILADYEKIQSLQKLGPIEGFVGAMICDTRENKSVDSLLHDIQQGVGQTPILGELERSSGGWNWRFAVIAVG